MLPIVSLILFYFIGAFPTGYLIARSRGVDIARSGSGNIGATNVARSLGKKAGIFTLVGDIVKGVIAVLVATALTELAWYPAAAGVAAVAGHCFSIPSFLRGGKGVAVSLGVLLTLWWPAPLAGCTAFAAIFLFSRIVSLSSISAAIAAPIFTLLYSPSPRITSAVVMISAIVIIKHAANIKRLLNGKEPRFF